MNIAATNSVRVATRHSPKLFAMLALVAGLGIVFLTGFAGSATLHNAAHDTRHAMAFPCH